MPSGPIPPWDQRRSQAEWTQHLHEIERREQGEADRRMRLILWLGFFALASFACLVDYVIR